MYSETRVIIQSPVVIPEINRTIHRLSTYLGDSFLYMMHAIDVLLYPHVSPEQFAEDVVKSTSSLNRLSVPEQEYVKKEITVCIIMSARYLQSNPSVAAMINYAQHYRLKIGVTHTDDVQEPPLLELTIRG